MFLGCKKEAESPSASDNTATGDSLPERENLFLDSLSVINPALTDIIGNNGKLLARTQSSSLVANLVDGMLTQAQALSGTKIISHPAEGDTRPEPKGIAYSYGQRDLTQRLNPAAGNDLHRKYAVFGTDCSGLMINLLQSQGVSIANTNVTGFEAALRTVIVGNSKFPNVTVKNLGNLQPSKIPSGDFIAWPAHIGIIAVLRNSSKIVYQSNGDGQPKDIAAQTKNLSIKRGVNPKSLSEAIHGNGYWGTQYDIIRLKAGVQIGDTLQGGVVFDIDQTGLHGYICAPVDQSSGATWNDAIAQCSAYRGGGFRNWTLPTNEQLYKLYANKDLVGGFSTGCDNNNFRNCSYWSADANGSTNAWAIYFTTGGMWSNYTRTSIARARAVRAF